MAQNILGIDLGTNSIGIALRNPDLGENLIDQLEYYSSVVFKSGVGKDKSGEYSYAAERTKYRSTRRTYQARKYRIWATLQMLRDFNMCPLSQKDLDKWSRYDKSKGFKRQYPIDAVAFEQWVRLDFDGDGVADYSSPYQLRAELMERQFDFTQQIERYKLGRAIYHIAQRRGFKSSKGETLSEQKNLEKNGVDVDVVDALKKSEEKKSKAITTYMSEHNLPTVGCAMADLERHGIRVRNSEYTPVRSQYKDEIRAIFEFQDGLDVNSDLYNRIVSEKKYEGTIFYKRPLRSQKGLVGKCTLEPNKPRCAISHPDFEDFRAWSFINNIKYRTDSQAAWQTLSLDQRERLYDEVFLLTRSNFKFEVIRKWMEIELQIHLGYEQHTINFKDRTSVSGCPISGRLKNLLGTDWRQVVINVQRNNKQEQPYNVSYNYEDLWHICFSYDEGEAVGIFASEVLGWDEKDSQALQRIWGAIPQGYSMLSLKAIRNINRFLHKGLIYTDATLLAKLPDILGQDKWQEVEPELLSQLQQIVERNRGEKQMLNIVNNLISQHKVRCLEDKSAHRPTDYLLGESDFADINQAILDTIGERRWNALSESDQQTAIDAVAQHYQQYFADSKRQYFTLPKLGEALKSYVINQFSCDEKLHWERMYHPSEIKYFAEVQAKNYTIDGRVMSLRRLPKPTLGSIKNPVALRTLHILRNQINAMLKRGMIDDETRIVVETARELNDANMRWAIETYQRQRDDENKEFEAIINTYFPGRIVSKTDIDKVRLLTDQYDIIESKEAIAVSDKNKSKDKQKAEAYKKDVTKYRLWLEQGCRSVYTGEIISLTKLFDDSQVDIEHTIPRSVSFDDSLQNLTVCEAHFNRAIKKNMMPSQLDNYDEILIRIQPWIDKVEHLKDQVDSWRAQSKRATDMGRKNDCIRQRHLWEMELEYWKAKVDRFLIRKEDLTQGFRNSQLVDTRIITKYAFHFLKSAFNNVDVQRGEVTSVFRKVVGVQSVDERKSRDLHSHHAIDAAMLTIVPVAAKRDKMMQLFYEIDEAQKYGKECMVQQNELHNMVASCRIGNISGLVETINSRILVNQITKDQTLTPAHKCKRVRGKVEKDKDGNPIWLQGDSMRASLHKETIYGAIRYPKMQDGVPLRENGEWVYETDKEGHPMLYMVLNTPIENITEKDVDTIVNPATRAAVEAELKKRKAGESPKDSPIYMLDANGSPITHDKNGHPISPIRHVRCKAKAGRGYLQASTAIQLKEQTYPSKAAYKNAYYVQNDDNYLCLLYEGIDKGKLIRSMTILNYFEAAQIDNMSSKDIMRDPGFETKTEGKKQYKLRAVIKKGTRVLLWEKTPDEITELDICQEREELSRRLYVVLKFNYMGSNYIYIRHHLDSRNNIPKEEQGAAISQKNFPYLHLTADNFNCLIEHVDFEIDDIGDIHLL